MNFKTMGAIFKRDFRSFFVSLKGYIFVVAFVVLTVLFAFRPTTREFFVNNRATLDLLNELFPYLLVFFIPVVTMSAWAQEKQQGTDQLLLTLPVHDHEIVISKYLACLAVYTTALAFTLTNVLILAYLGDPDYGLIVSSYVGYLLLGAAWLALAMLGSSMASGLTTSWLLGGALVSLPLLPEVLSVATNLTGTSSAFGRLAGVWNELNALRRFEAFGHGVVALGDVIYFVTLTGAALYANTLWLGKRHWTIARSKAFHQSARLACIGLSAVCLVMLGRGAAARMDVTEARMLSVRPETKKVLERLHEKDENDKLKIPPVIVQAWISPEVPEDYKNTRDGLIRMLQEFDSEGGDQVRVVIYDTELYSEEAQRAEKSYGIRPRSVTVRRNSANSSEEIFLGLAFTCGPRELKIPFFDRGLPVQYELTRAIGAVARFEQKKIGVLKSGVDLFGGFDFKSMNSREDWQVLGELRRQYDVQKVDGTAAISTELDVLVVPLPSSLPQPEMDRVLDYLYAGGKALVLCDPFPTFDPNLAPMRPAGGKQNPFGPRKPPSKPKGDIEGFMSALGLRWRKDRVVWDAYNPHPQWQLPKEIVIVGPKDPSEKESVSGFADHPISKGLQELILLHGGELEDSSGEQIKITPLLRTRTVAGFHVWGDLITESFMGIRPKDPSTLNHKSAGEPRVLSVVAEGTMASTRDRGAVKKGQRSNKPFQAVVLADMDGVSDVFFQIRRQGNPDMALELDNVTFLANAIDWLAGDDTYIELRKLRPKHRTLKVFEKVRKDAEQEQRKVVDAAKDESKKKLTEAQKRLDEAVEKIRSKEDVDFRTKQGMVIAAQERENRRLQLQKAKIEDEERSKVRLSQTDAQRQIRAVENRNLTKALIAAVIPVLFLGLFVLWRKATLEGATMDDSRRRTA